MVMSIQNVNGVGPAAAEALAQHGVVTPEQLAASTVEVISKVPGFSEARAQRIITAAQALANPDSAPKAAVTEAPVTAPGDEAGDEPVGQDPATDTDAEEDEETGETEKGKKKKDKDKKKKKKKSKKGKKGKKGKKKNKGKKKKKKK